MILFNDSLLQTQVPGQRALALQLLSSILNNSLHNLQKEGDVSEIGVDWQAVWAFSLGPEPQLALSLRSLSLKLVSSGSGL